MCWEDLHAMVFAAPPGSAVFHAIEQGWSTTDHLLAHAVDALMVANWQRTEDATKKQPKHRPDQLPRPKPLGSEKPEQSAAEDKVVNVGGVAAKVTTVGEFLALRAKREERWRQKQRAR